MINKIAKITVYVDDQEEAKTFWTHKLGFVIRFEQPMVQNAAWIEVSPEDNEFTTLILYSKSLMEEQQPGKVAHPSILFSTKDIKTAYDKMKNNDVKVSDLETMPYGTMFTFYDQDGNEYLLREDNW